MKVTDILQYPVKGLSEEALDNTELVVNVGMPADRVFAISHAKSQFDHAKPAWVERKHFAVVAHSPEICQIHAQFDHVAQVLTLLHGDNELMQSPVNADDIDAQLTAALSSVIKDGQAGPYRLARAGNTRMTDIPTPTVSIMNTKSLQAVEDAVGHPIDRRRFRGNIWFDGDHAWQENEWVGKAIHIGDTKLYVNERIQRCAAVDADPVLGQRDLAVLKQLNTSFDHTDFGVLAEIEKGGVIQSGDAVSQS